MFILGFVVRIQLSCIQHIPIFVSQFPKQDMWQLWPYSVEVGFLWLGVSVLSRSYNALVCNSVLNQINGHQMWCCYSFLAACVCFCLPFSRGVMASEYWWGLRVFGSQIHWFQSSLTFELCWVRCWWPCIHCYSLKVVLIWFWLWIWLVFCFSSFRWVLKMLRDLSNSLF